MTSQPVCQFSDRLSSAISSAEGLHSHDGGQTMHVHGGEGQEGRTWARPPLRDVHPGTSMVKRTNTSNMRV